MMDPTFFHQDSKIPGIIGIIEEEEPPISDVIIAVPQTKKAKRGRNPENWKKEKRKRAILSGQSYINTRGDLVSKKEIGPNCNCKQECYQHVTRENRETIFNSYYLLRSYDEQNAYLYGLIRRCDIKRKRQPVSERRTCSYKYFLRVKGKEIQVCKKAFSNIHGISDKKIRTLCVKHEQNILFPRDNRGRHSNRPKKVTPEITSLVKHHILKCLSGPNGADFMKTDKNQGTDVNLTKLHRKFLEEFEPDAVDPISDKLIKEYDPKVKAWLYFRVFHNEFNSMDFNTVKRKLQDLSRKSLEANGQQTGAAKRKSKPKTPKKVPQPIATMESNSHQSAASTPVSSVSHAPPPHNWLSSQLGGVGQHQQPAFGANLQLGMLSLQQQLQGAGQPPGSFMPPVSQVQQSHSTVSSPHNLQASHNMQQNQPLNLQTHSGMDTASTHQQLMSQGDNPLPFQLHSMAPHPMSSYYLCLGHVSNLLPVQAPSPPTSSSGQNNFQGPGQGNNMGYNQNHNGNMF